MTAEFPSPDLAPAREPGARLTRAELRDIVETVLFYGILGIGAALPFGLWLYGLLFR